MTDPSNYLGYNQTMTKVCIKTKALSNIARLPKSVPERESFNPEHSKRNVNNKTATVLTQLLMVVHEITTRECHQSNLGIGEKDKDFNHSRSEGWQTMLLWEFLLFRGGVRSPKP